MIGISKRDRDILREDHRRQTLGQAGRGSLHRRAGGGSVSTEYMGYFKVKKYTEDGEDTYWVVNGADPDALICGSFTAGSSNISCDSEMVAVSGAGVVYLRIYYDEEYLYEFGFASTLPSADDEIYITLASISADGTPAQVWTDGAITYLNGSYWL